MREEGGKSLKLFSTELTTVELLEPMKRTSRERLVLLVHASNSFVIMSCQIHTFKVTLPSMYTA